MPVESQGSGVRGVRGQESGVRNQESGVRGQKSEVRSQGYQSEVHHNPKTCADHFSSRAMPSRMSRLSAPETRPTTDCAATFPDCANCASTFHVYVSATKLSVRFSCSA